MIVLVALVSQNDNINTSFIIGWTINSQNPKTTSYVSGSVELYPFTPEMLTS